MEPYAYWQFDRKMLNRWGRQLTDSRQRVYDKSDMSDKSDNFHGI